MKSSVYFILCLLCLLINEFALFENEFVIYNSTRILYKVLMLIAFLKFKPTQITIRYIIFISLVFLSDIIAFFAYFDNFDWGYTLVVLFFLIYIVLLSDCWNKFKLGRFNVIALSYVIIMALNTALIVFQLRGLYNHISGQDVIFVGQVVYHFTLLCVVGVSIAYYLNSYSQKSMLFLMGSLLFVCSDILSGAHYFYGIGNYILAFSGVMSAGGYFFFFNYFHVKEDPLLTEAEIIIDIEKKTESKRLAED